VAGLLGEKVVASCTEAFPNLIRIFTWNGSNLLPALLQVDKVLGGFFPLRAILQAFGLYAKFGFKLQVI
jgi:hypothetical protein